MFFSDAVLAFHMGLSRWRPQLAATTAYQETILSDSLRLSDRLDRAEAAFALEDIELDSHFLSWRQRKLGHALLRT